MFHTLKYGEGEGRKEYLVTNQHNGNTLEKGYVLRRTYFNSHVSSLGGRFYDDGNWHSMATAPHEAKLWLFASLEDGLAAARDDAAHRGLKETTPAEPAAPVLALEFTSGYQTPAERLAAPVPEDTYVRCMAFSSRPRVR